MTDQFHGWLLARLCRHLRSFFEHGARVLGAQTHQLLSSGCLHGRPLQRPLADEIHFVLADGPSQPGVIGRHGAVGVLADDDVALLRAQHVHGLGAVFGDAVRLARRMDGLPHAPAEIRRHVDLESQFAGEAHAKQQHRHTANPPAAHAHMRPRRTDIDVLHQCLEHPPRIRTLHGDDGPLLRGRSEPHPELRPFGLAVVLHQREDTGRAARGGGHVEAIGAGARHDAIVEDEAIFAEQYSVARSADAEVGPIVDIQAVHEFGCIGARDFDLAEGRGVEYPTGATHRAAFARNGGMHVFAAARKVAGSLPQGHILEHGAFGFRPSVGRRGAHRIEQIAARNAGHAAEGDGGEGHAKGGQSHLRDGHIEVLGHDGHGVEIRGLALIGCHPRGGIALDVFDRAKSFAGGKSEVAGRHVVLPVDEGLILALCLRLRQHAEVGLTAALERVHVEAAPRLARFRSRRCAGRRTVRHRVREIIDPAAGAGGTLALRRCARHEGREIFAPLELAARLRKQVHAGRVAAGHQHRIAADAPPRLHLVALHASQGDGIDAQIAFGAEHGRSRKYVDARAARGVGQGAHRLRAQVGDRCNGDACCLEIQGRLIRSIAGGHDDRAGADAHAVAIQVRQRRSRQQNSRPIVAGKHQRTFDRPGGEHHRARAHLPQPLARLMCRRGREMVVEPLIQADEIVREIAEGGGARKQRHAAVPGQRGDGVLHPCGPALPVDQRAGVGQQAAAELGGFIA